MYIWLWRGMLSAVLVAAILPALSWGEELTLQKAVDLTLSNNRLLSARRHDAGAAKWGRAASVSDYFPKVYFNSSVMRIDPDSYDEIKDYDESRKDIARATGEDPSVFEPSGYRDIYSSSIQVVQPIFNGGAEIVGIQAAGREARRQNLGAEETAVATVNQVKKAYYEAQKAASLAATSAEALALSRETLKFTRARFQVGQLSRAELLRWESQEAQAEGDLIESSNGVRLARLNLNAVMGVDLDRVWDFPEMDLKASPSEEGGGFYKTEPLFLGLSEYRNHPGILEADALVELSKSERAGAVTQLLPKLNFIYNYAWEPDDTFDLDGDESWTATLSLEIPIFQSLGGAFGVAETHRKLLAAKKRRQEFQRTFLQRAFAAKLNMRSASQRVRAARSELAFAGENMRIVKTRQGLGAATNLDMLDAQFSYIQAKTRLVIALADFQIATAENEYVQAR